MSDDDWARWEASMEAMREELTRLSRTYEKSRLTRWEAALFGGVLLTGTVLWAWFLWHVLDWVF